MSDGWRPALVLLLWAGVLALFGYWWLSGDRPIRYEDWTVVAREESVASPPRWRVYVAHEGGIVTYHVSGMCYVVAEVGSILPEPCR